MRIVILDTETTRKDPKRIYEIACSALIDGRVNGSIHHSYVNPGSQLIKRANLSPEIKSKLACAPTFNEVADRILEFIGDSDVVAHVASFDRSVLNYELRLSGRAELPDSRWICSREMAYRLLPNNYTSPLFSPNGSAGYSLTDICRYFGITMDQKAHTAVGDVIYLKRIYQHLNVLTNCTTIVTAGVAPVDGATLSTSRLHLPA